jgi:peptidoglycan LD-endopeptidase LytH
MELQLKPEAIQPILPGLNKENSSFVDLSIQNISLSEAAFKDTSTFVNFIEKVKKEMNAEYLLGGYNEHRQIYKRSEHFEKEQEPRCIHLGIDIWVRAYTPFFSPLSGFVHSLKDNANFGDYGPTLIIKHEANGQKFHLLYGHLDPGVLEKYKPGMAVKAGEELGRIGNHPENGDWPPHLHFQAIINMDGMEGDYPGVCKMSERDQYISNCPNPLMFLKI